MNAAARPSLGEGRAASTQPTTATTEQDQDMTSTQTQRPGRRDTVKRRARVGDYVRTIDAQQRIYLVDEVFVEPNGRAYLFGVTDAETGLTNAFDPREVETLSAAFMADWSL
jgi:hypothetical protein